MSALQLRKMLIIKIFNGFQSVDLIGSFIPADSLNSWKTQRKSAGMPGTSIDSVEGHFKYYFWRDNVVITFISYGDFVKEIGELVKFLIRNS